MVAAVPNHGRRTADAAPGYTHGIGPGERGCDDAAVPKTFFAGFDQAIALRRRRLRHPVAPLRPSLEHAGGVERPGAGLPGAPRARRRRQHRHLRPRRDQYAHPTGADCAAHRAGRRPRPGRAGRSADEPVSARHGHRTPPARGRRAGLHRRLSRLRLPRHVAGPAARTQGSDGSRHLSVRGRGRGAPGDRSSRRLERHAQAAVQLHGRPAAFGRGRRSHPSRGADQANRRRHHQFRCRPRMPVSVLFLHHHQRAGPEIAAAVGGRCRADRPAKRRAGGQALLHHRRQLLAQPRLGEDLRPPDRVAAQGQAEHPVRDPGGYHVPPASALHREGGAGGSGARVHRAREHRSRQSGRRPEEAEQDHRVPEDAAGVEACRRHRDRGLHSRLSERHAGIDRARRADRPARTADRSSAVLLPHASAGLRGSPAPLQGGGGHGSRI